MSNEGSDKSNSQELDPSSLLNSMGKSIHNFIGDDNMKFINENKVTLLIALIITLIFIFVATFGYDNYVKPLLDKSYVPNKEFIKEDNNKNIDPEIYQPSISLIVNKFLKENNIPNIDN